MKKSCHIKREKTFLFKGDGDIRSLDFYVTY